MIKKWLNLEHKHMDFELRPHALKQNNASLFGICVYNKNILHIY